MTQEFPKHQLANLPESVTPKVTWEKVSPEDVLSGLKTLPSDIHVVERIVTEPGRGIDTTLEWAKDELTLAEQHPSDEERHASQAIIHAQCAIECLIDTYLERDWLTERLPYKPGLTQKIGLLSKRFVLHFPEVLLSEFVAEPRHDIIHRYKTRTAKDARVVVEAAFSIISSLKYLSDPHHGRVFAGILLGGSWTSKGISYQHFAGFSGPFGLTWRSSDKVVRAAVGTVSSKVNAEVWWAPVKEFTEEQHLALLDWWDSLQAHSTAYHKDFREILVLAGLDTL